MKTYSAKPGDVQSKWYVIDAEDAVVGRLAAVAARMLRGKHKPMFTPHIDCGDNVVVVNAEKVRFTGRKREDKVYYRHTGYPGGIRTRTPAGILDSARPGRVVEMAVRRMLPKGPLGRKQFRKLKVYAGAEHPHAAQRPEAIDLAALNRKNSRSGRA